MLRVDLGGGRPMMHWAGRAAVPEKTSDIDEINQDMVTL